MSTKHKNSQQCIVINKGVIVTTLRGKNRLHLFSARDKKNMLFQSTYCIHIHIGSTLFVYI